MKEVRAIIEIWQLSPVLTLKEAAEYARCSTGTLQNHVSEGRYEQSAIKGKPLRFVTPRFIQEVAARREGRR